MACTLNWCSSFFRRHRGYLSLIHIWQIMRAIIEGRDERDLTQKQLAEVTGIAQADISRFENGTGNPSLRTLKRLAEGLGMSLKVEFVPKSTSA